MNYAVHSASAVAFSCRRPSVTPMCKLHVRTGLPTTERRITINVGGERFQTFENTLARYPDSLLGSPERRQEFYNAGRNEFAFPARDKNVFNAILFFYQAKILSRPDDVPLDVFVDEVKFFDLARYSVEIPAPRERNEQVPTGDGSCRLRLWNFVENPQTRLGDTFAKVNLLLVFIWLFISCLETSAGEAKTVVGNISAVSQTASKNHPNFTLNYSGARNVSLLAGNAPDPMPDSREKVYSGWPDDSWFILDTVFVAWFTLDYLVHIVCEPSLRSYLLSPIGVIDLVTILPYYITLIMHGTGGTPASQMGALRFLRVFRLFKAARYSSAFRILLGSLTSSAKDFPVWFILMVMHIIFFSSILYYIESDANNPQFSNIPDVMYFTVITMCAVGYGDVVPQSALGKIVTSIAALSGIVIVYCIPAPTLKTNFNRLNELHKHEKKERERLKCNGGVH